MTTEEKNEIAEKLKNIELESFGMLYEGELLDEKGDIDFYGMNDSIERDIKFIRQKLDIPEPNFEI